MTKEIVVLNYHKLDSPACACQSWIGSQFINGSVDALLASQHLKLDFKLLLRVRLGMIFSPEGLELLKHRIEQILVHACVSGNRALKALRGYHTSYRQCVGRTEEVVPRQWPDETGGVVAELILQRRSAEWARLVMREPVSKTTISGHMAAGQDGYGGVIKSPLTASQEKLAFLANATLSEFLRVYG